ncbi:MAG TPA: YidB family protein [Denitromonas sp.]|nr:YidB family protein [Denitromonas sp.]HQV13561.1 YidB family protein [Denitromonas sp.]
MVRHEQDEGGRSMGLLDQLAGQVLGGGSGSAENPMMDIVKGLIQNSEGGLPGLLSRLQSGGLGGEVASWLGQGENQPVGADALSQAIGPDVLAQVASQAGMSQPEAASGLAGALPQLIDMLSPNGQVDDNSEMLQQGLSMLGGLFGSR